MRGSTKKRGNTWTFVGELGPDPATGRRRQKRLSGFRTKKEAQAAGAALHADVAEGSYTEPAKLTTKKFLTEQWLPATRATVRQTTADNYANKIDTYVVPAIGAVPLQALNAGHLDRLYGELAVHGRRDGRPLSTGSIRAVHTVIHKALAAAVEWDLVRANVANRAHPPRAEQRQQGYWTPAQVARFLEATAEDRWGTLILLAATTGARRGELLGLCWPEVDLNAGRISISRTRTVSKGKVLWSEPKTARSRRSVALDPVTAASMRSWRAQQSAERLVMGGRWGNGEDIVFVWPDGTPPNPEAFTLRFKRLVEKAGLPKLTPKGLRHSFATAGLVSGVPIKTISSRLGHSSIRITGDVYSHVIPELDSDAAETVANLFLRTAPSEVRDQSVTNLSHRAARSDTATP